MPPLPKPKHAVPYGVCAVVRPPRVNVFCTALAACEIPRYKTNLDIFWLKDDSLEDIDALPIPDIIAVEIAESLCAALEQFVEVSEELSDAG